MMGPDLVGDTVAGELTGWMDAMSDSMDLNAQKDLCLRLCASIREDVLSNVLDVETRVCSNGESFSTKSTVSLWFAQNAIRTWSQRRNF